VEKAVNGSGFGLGCQIEDYYLVHPRDIGSGEEDLPAHPYVSSNFPTCGHENA
jgi:hypothetical protein